MLDVTSWTHCLVFGSPYSVIRPTLILFANFLWEEILFWLWLPLSENEDLRRNWQSDITVLSRFWNSFRITCIE
jgi:hypothetical protein